MTITAVIDPEVLVLGGPIGIHPLLLAQVQETLDELAPASTKVVCQCSGRGRAAAGGVGTGPPPRARISLASRQPGLTFRRTRSSAPASR
jgi:hypothetical protein